MPVHEIRYKALDAPLTGDYRRLLAIPKFTLMSVFNKYLAALMFGIGSLQMLAYTGFLVISNSEVIRKAINMRSNQMVDMAAHDVFRRFLLVQLYICIMALLIAAPRVISQERANNGLPIIFSRPIGRFGYIFGKFGALGIILAYLTVIQVVFLFLVMWANYPPTHLFHTDFWTYSIPMLVRALLQCALMIFSLGFLGLACSAATTQAGHATILFLAIIFGASLVSEMAQNSFAPQFPELGLREVLNASNIKLLDASVTGRALLELKAEGTASQRIFWGQATDVTTINVILGFLFWGGVSLAFMRWRLRPFDIYKG